MTGAAATSGAGAGAAGAGARLARRKARLAAVQALYQIDLVAVPPQKAIDEFAGRARLQADDSAHGMDLDFFAALVRGAAATGESLDARIGETLAAGWRLERLPVITRALLRAATFELERCRDIPPRVTVSEFVDLAGGFLNDADTGFVNGVLETLARRLRGEDWDRAAGPGGAAGAGDAPG